VIFLLEVKNPGSINIAYVCLDDDTLGLQASLILQQLLHRHKTPIVVRMAEKRGIGYTLQGDGAAAAVLRI